DHSTLARFRTGRCKEAVEDLFYQFVRKLEEVGETDHKAVFIDGTKLESRAGRYTFVWRKTVEKHLGQVKAKLKSMTGLSTCAAVRSMLEEEASKIAFVSGTGRRKGQA
ncbi:transposase, partial [Intestinimonas butyriciproducens]|nr:transposase [Intestinimonas butyriciproducens]